MSYQKKRRDANSYTLTDKRSGREVMIKFDPRYETWAALGRTLHTSEGPRGRQRTGIAWHHLGEDVATEKSALRKAKAYLRGGSRRSIRGLRRKSSRQARRHHSLKASYRRAPLLSSILKLLNEVIMEGSVQGRSQAKRHKRILLTWERDYKDAIRADDGEEIEELEYAFDEYYGDAEELVQNEDFM